jgi:pSer/pThr/pTyr-binding forkhead associated (FHA) protein
MSGPILLVLRLLLTISLYAFLGWAFFVLWRDLSIQSKLLASRRTPPITLIFEEGEANPKKRHFDQSEITVGRDPTCDCPLLDETVSARHARLAYHHGQWWLEDLGSTNGTKLNESPVTMPTVVISEDKINCGEAAFTVSLGNEINAPATTKKM